MKKELEIKTIIHFKDGYFGRIEIGINPDAPEIYTNIKSFEDNKEVCNMCFPDELLPDLIRALNIYMKNKKEIR